MSNSVTSDSPVEALLTRVPAFAAARLSDESYMSHDDDSPYLVFGDFARFLIEVITGKSDLSDRVKLLAESFELLGEMATSADDEVVNLAEVGAFEVLSDSPESVAAAREYLPDKALLVFERVVSPWTPTSRQL